MQVQKNKNTSICNKRYIFTVKKGMLVNRESALVNLTV